MLAAAIAAMSSCSSSSDAVTTTGTDPQLLVMSEILGTDAQVFGQLRYLDEEQCFVLEVADPATGDVDRAPVVWPPGTRPIKNDDGQVGVRVPDVGEILEGTWLLGGGSGQQDGAPDDLPDLPSGCFTSPDYIFVESVIETSTQPIGP